MPNPTYAATAWAVDPIDPSHWSDAARLSPDARARLLAAATDACRSWAPVLAPGDEIPAGWVLGCIYAARDAHAAAQRAGATDVVGVGEYALRVRGLSTVVKALLRPEAAVPAVG